MAYSKEELREMAEVLLAAKKNGDNRYLEFVISMVVRTGLPPEAIDQKIVEFARAE